MSSCRSRIPGPSTFQRALPLRRLRHPRTIPTDGFARSTAQPHLTSSPLAHQSQPSQRPACTRPLHTTSARLGGNQASRPHRRVIARQAGLNTRNAAYLIDPRLLEQHSTRQTELDATHKLVVFNDFGLVPGTLVLSGFIPSIMPSFFTAPLRRLRMERQRLWHRTRQILALLVFRAEANGQGAPGPRHYFRFWHIPAQALRLHREVYEAVAAKDAKSLRKLCCVGLAEELAQQANLRPAGLRYEWRVKYKGRPKVMNHTATSISADQIPRNHDGSKSAFRQAVVRIKSVQTLTVLADHAHAGVDADTARMQEGEGDEAVSSEIEKEVTEYIVIQQDNKEYTNAERFRWRMWGVTKETLADDWDTVVQFKQKERNAKPHRDTKSIDNDGSSSGGSGGTGGMLPT